MLVVDSLDVGYGMGEGDGRSSSIADLLATNQHLLPGWLLLVCSIRRHNKAMCKMFSSMNKPCRLVLVKHHECGRSVLTGFVFTLSV